METTTAVPIASGTKTKWAIDPAHSEILFKVKNSNRNLTTQK